MLRAAGIIALHDEIQAYASETAAMRDAGIPIGGWDAVAIVTAFKAVVLEGLEVVFIVIAVGAVGHMLVPASLGAGLAGVLVVVLGLALHRPLARVPENGLKFAVGVILSAFGIFWVGKGLGYEWPGDDLSIIGLVLSVLAIALGTLPTLRRQAAVGGTARRDRREAVE